MTSLKSLSLPFPFAQELGNMIRMPTLPLALGTDRIWFFHPGPTPNHSKNPKTSTPLLTLVSLHIESEPFSLGDLFAVYYVNNNFISHL